MRPFAASPDVVLMGRTPFDAFDDADVLTATEEDIAGSSAGPSGTRVGRGLAVLLAHLLNAGDGWPAGGG